jgi:hypothetical protein
MNDADAFEHDDAAYVMGLLSTSERAAFETHLKTCAACAERVRTLTPAGNALGSLTAADLLALDDIADEPMPDTLLPGLLRRAGVRQRRQRQFTTGVSALAAASLVSLAVVVWPSGGTAAATRPLAMSAVSATPLHATAVVSDLKWGTRISLDCSYPDYEPKGTERAFGLTVVAKDGTSQLLGTWKVAAGQHTRFTSGTSLPASDISAVEITGSDGVALLSLKV